jgi:23S rRNA (uracil1939-C5)-methyltransferase
MDPLGQGVSRKTGRVTFVAGTLPGETGTAVVYKRSKGVQFARLKSLDKIAESRVEPACPHFDLCPGCQYLHTGYDKEIEYKRATLQHFLAALDVTPDMIEVQQAPRRLSYRNRVQLHYRHQYIGMLDGVANQVLPVPQCKIIRPELQQAFDQLYEKNWTRDHTGHGHCEIYRKSGEVGVSWDEEYAHGGFSQVNDDMNENLQNRVQQLLEQTRTKRLLDLFSGTGNLSNVYAENGGERVLIDSFKATGETAMPEKYYSMDLYDEETLQNFSRQAGCSDFDTLLIDPPRRGFPELNNWVNRLKPRHLVYVSCNPASLAHDVRSLSKRFRIKTIELLDMFPATSHFETLLLLEIR